MCAVNAAGSFLAACRVTSGGVTTASPTPAVELPVELVVMAYPSELSEDDFSQFYADYSPIHLTRLEPALDALRRQMAAGVAPDVIRLEALQIPYAVRQGWCSDLSAYFSASGALRASDLYPINDLCLVGGKRYGALLEWSPDFSIWINQKLWQQAGVTVPQSYEQGFSLTQWRELSPLLTRREGQQVQVIGTDFEPGSRFLIWAAAAQNPPASLFDQEGRLLVLRGNPLIFEAIKFIEEWKKEGGLPVDKDKVLSASRPTAAADFDCT